MKKLIALILALCLSAACFAAFAEEKKDEKTDAKTEEKAEEAANEYEQLQKIYGQLSEEEREAFETVQMYFTIYQIFNALDIKDNDYFKTAEKVQKAVLALGEYFKKNGDKVTDPAELAKADDLKEFADILEGKEIVDPAELIRDALFFNMIDDTLIEDFEDLRTSDAIFETAIAADLLGDEFKDNETLKIFKSVLDYAKELDEDEVKSLIAASEAVVKGLLGSEEGKKLVIEILKLIADVPADKVQAFEKESKEAIQELHETLKEFRKAIEDASGSADEDAPEADGSDEAAPEEDKAA